MSTLNPAENSYENLTLLSNLNYKPKVRIGRPPCTEVTPRLQEQRKANLALITKRPGFKSALCKLVNMSAANLSHRLYGLTIIREGDVLSFTKALELEKGWFDRPQSVYGIPLKTLEILRNAKKKTKSNSMPEIAITSEPISVTPSIIPDAPDLVNPTALTAKLLEILNLKITQGKVDEKLAIDLIVTLAKL